jgi:hypothetical protein
VLTRLIRRESGSSQSDVSPHRSHSAAWPADSEFRKPARSTFAGAASRLQRSVPGYLVFASGWSATWVRPPVTSLPAKASPAGQARCWPRLASGDSDVERALRPIPGASDSNSCSPPSPASHEHDHRSPTSDRPRTRRRSSHDIRAITGLLGDSRLAPSPSSAYSTEVQATTPLPASPGSASVPPVVPGSSSQDFPRSSGRRVPVDLPVKRLRSDPGRPARSWTDFMRRLAASIGPARVRDEEVTGAGRSQL